MAFAQPSIPYININRALRRLQQEEAFARLWGHDLRASAFREARIMIEEEVRSIEKVVHQTPIFDVNQGQVIRR